MRSVNTVIHLGAIVGDPACALDEELTIDTNLLATRMIAEVTKGQGIERFIFRQHVFCLRGQRSVSG